MIIASNTAHMILTLESIQDTRLLKRKIFYHKPQPGKEIDLLIDVRGRLTPIEVYSGEKSTPTTSKNWQKRANS